MSTLIAPHTIILIVILYAMAKTQLKKNDSDFRKKVVDIYKAVGFFGLIILLFLNW